MRGHRNQRFADSSLLGVIYSDTVAFRVHCWIVSYMSCHVSSTLAPNGVLCCRGQQIAAELGAAVTGIWSKSV